LKQRNWWTASRFLAVEREEEGQKEIVWLGYRRRILPSRELGRFEGLVKAPTVNRHGNFRVRANWEGRPVPPNSMHFLTSKLPTAKLREVEISRYMWHQDASPEASQAGLHQSFLAASGGYHPISEVRIADVGPNLYRCDWNTFGIPTVQYTLVNIVPALRLVSFQSLLKLSALEEQ
jgi:hypothetical protein